jgi:hypothetical protein
MQHYLMIPCQLRDTRLCSVMSTQKINLHGEGERTSECGTASFEGGFVTTAKRWSQVWYPVPTGGRGGSRYKLPARRHPEGGPEPDYVAHVFGLLGSIIICLLSKLTFSDQTQVLQLRVSLSDIA